MRFVTYKRTETSLEVNPKAFSSLEVAILILQRMSTIPLLSWIPQVTEDNSILRHAQICTVLSRVAIPEPHDLCFTRSLLLRAFRVCYRNQ